MTPARKKWLEDNKERVLEYKRKHFRKKYKECKDQINKRTNEWKKNNKDKVLSTQRKWIANNIEHKREYEKNRKRSNPEEYRERGKRYYVKNKERICATVKEWCKNNPIKTKTNLQNYRARKRYASGYSNYEQLEARIKFFGNACAYCRGVAEHVDHVIPLAKGGTNWPANLRPACASCNCTKSDGDWKKWNIKL